MDSLHQLISRLNKTEVRCFKQFAVKHNKQDNIYIKLFDFLNGQAIYDAKAEKQYINMQHNSDNVATIRTYLYKTLIKSLKNHYGQPSLKMQIRQSLDKAEVLFNKQMFKEALKQLKKAKKIAKDAEYFPLYLEVLDTEREMQLLTTEWSEGKGARSDFDIELSITDIIKNRYAYQELGIKFSEKFKNTFERISKKDMNALTKLSLNPLLKSPANAMTTKSKIIHYNSLSVYSMFLGDWAAALKFANEYMAAVEDTLDNIPENKLQYINVLFNLLILCERGGYEKEMNQTLEKLHELRGKWASTNNMQLKVALYGNVNLVLLGHYITKNEFKKAGELVKGLVQILKTSSEYLPTERLHLLYYQISYYYFATKQFELCLDYLDFPLRYYKAIKRRDVYIYAQILLIIAHYEMGNVILAYNICVVVQKRIRQMKEANEEDIQAFKFLLLLLKTDDLELSNSMLKRKKYIISDNLMVGYLNFSDWYRKKLSS